MTAATALARLRDLGVAAEARGDGLVLRPASAVPPDLLAELRQHKRELLALLGEPANDAEPAPGPGDMAAALAAAAAAGAAAAADHIPDDSAPDDDPPAPAPPMPELPPPGTAARAALDARHAATVAGWLAAAAIRPPSWTERSPHQPMPGATCSCCRGRRWWSEAEPHREAGWGWRCVCCHPPAPEAVVQMAGQSPVTRDEVGGENGGGR